MSVTFYPACGDGEPELNVANGNFSRIMNQLGLREDCVGRWTPEELPRIKEIVAGTLTLALNHDTTIPNEEFVGAGGARIVNMGWDDNYLKERLTQLLCIIDYAIKMNVEVRWA